VVPPLARGVAGRRRLRAAALLALAAACGAGRAAAEPSTAEDIERCVRENLPNASSVLTVAFRTRDRGGAETESRATLFWQRADDGLSRVMMRFADPRDLRGAGLLLLERRDRRPDTFMYLPELRTVRRVASRTVAGSMFGTDFSYEDFERLLGMAADASRARLPDAELEGRPVYVVEGRPAPDSGSAYERVVTFVDRERCVALRTESWERAGGLRKVLVADPQQITREGSDWVARSQKLSDLRDETQTLLLIEELKLDQPIPRKMFSERELEAGG
jgi:hypothetical protein